MKDIFEELEAEVDQNVVNRKHDEIERKNLLIANDNLIVDCLFKEVFYIATNSELTVSRVTEMHEAHTIVQTRCLELKAELFKSQDKVQKDDHTKLVKHFSNLETRSEADRTLDFMTLDFQITQLTKKVTVLQEQNELFRAKNEKVKHHYKELYNSIKITRTKRIEQTTALLTKNENLKAQTHENLKCNTMESVKPRVLAPGRYAIDVEPIPPHNKNNREVHLHYLKHLKESVETLREIVEEVKVDRPLDRSIVSAYRYTKHSQELLEYAIGTCPKAFNQRDKKHAPTPLIRKKQVTFEEQCDMSNSNTHKHVEQLNTQKTNVPVPPSIGVNCCTNASGSQPRSNTKKNKIWPAKGVNKKKVEEHPRINKSNLRTTNRVDSSSSSKRTVINLNSDSVCQTFLRTPQQNGIVERRNCTLVEAARTMLIFSKAPMNYGQKLYALCYPKNDSEDLRKLQPTANIGIFVGYAPSRKGYRIYNKRTRRIMETIHVQFDGLTEQMATVQLSIGPASSFLTPGLISSGLVPNPVPAAPYVPPTNKELEILF
ncbi:retrovirus-related pol polyprotein from transposon TNT 1-94 [Tanacetum coccineum]|uniref:Retrovirus-related pol polyprotein from transposon TNT 1-94 n=1 Tax=Tanacetum coccineum TaxID=301880 RepID=A0ABQ5BPU3_9ASTR